MTLPKRIYISPHWYSVKEEKGFSSVTGLNGACGVDSGSIIVEPENSPTQIRETILHESLHGIINQLSYFDDDKEEEKFIKLVTPRLLSLIRDNPSLVEYLREK